MRIFWAVVGLLMVGAAAWLFLGRGADGGSSSQTAERPERGSATTDHSGSEPPAPPQTAGIPQTSTPASTPDKPAGVAGGGAQAPKVQKESVPAALNEPTVSNPQAVAPTPPQHPTSTPPSTEAARPREEPIVPADASPTPKKPVTPAPENEPAPAPAAPTTTGPATPTAPASTVTNNPKPTAPTSNAPSKPASESPNAAPSSASPDRSPATAPTGPSDTAAPAKAAASTSAVSLETNADGTTLVDHKFTLKGKGTKEEPYVLTWDQLVSAQDDYVPKDGRKVMPGRISMLNDKWVQLTGFIAFPVMADSLDECLSMMNQWDGCCVGVPPTPYDAVEVHLTKAAEGKDRMASYGFVRGKLKVEPQLVGGWLVGLYVMDDASMTPQTFGGIAP